MNQYMKEAKEAALKGIQRQEGGPFGAVIVDKNGVVIARGNNRVLIDHDPTAHAEIIAIREACQIRHSHDLNDCVLYTSCEPCPMCLSAIVWANIKEVYYACTKEDAAKIGFRDDILYQYFEGKGKNLLTMHNLDRKECINVMEEYEINNHKLY